MARKLIVEIIGDSTKLVRSLNQSTTAANRFGTEVTGSAGRAEKSLTKLQRVAAGGFIGAAAFSAGAVALRRVFDAASESQQVLGQTQVALESTGKSWAQYGETIERAIRSQSRLGFDDEELLKTFGLFVRQSRDVDEALRRNAIAMDVARARFIDLEQAAALVNKAALGQAGALRRVGIDAQKGASGVELLAQLERQFAGAAEDASTKAVGATDRLKVSIENVEETLGSALLPMVTEFAVALSDAADGAVLLAEKLRALGSVKIPAIEIPLNFTVPGTDSKVFDVAKEIAQQAGPFSFFFRAQDIANLFRDQPKPDTSAAASLFDAQVDTFVEGLEKGRDKAVAKGNRRLKAFGEKGFKAIETNELGEKLQRQFDALMEALDLRVDQATASGNTQRALALLEQTEAAIRKRITVEGRTTDLLRQLFQVQQQRKSVLDGIAQQRDEARQARAAAALEGLGLAVDRAKLTKGVADDLRALQDLAAGLRKQIAKGGDVASLEQQLVSTVQEIANVREQRAAALRDALATSQFRQLGVGPGGEEFIPGIKNLRKQFEQLSDSVVGQDVPQKLLNRLNAVGKVLAKSGRQLQPEVRDWINDLFGTIRGTFDDQSKRLEPQLRHVQLSDKILAALGFGQDPDVTARQRLDTRSLVPRQTLQPSAVSAGPPTVNINGSLTVVSDDPDAFLRDLQKRAGRTTATSRGRFPGRSLGLG